MARFYKPKTAKQSPSQQTVSVNIERLSHDGRGLAHHQGKTLFVEGALATESVDVTLTKVHRRYLEGRVTKLSTACESRIAPPCAVFSRCGGCRLQYMPQSDQVAYKEQALFEQLARVGIEPRQRLAPLLSEPYRYRQRVRLAIDSRAKVPRMGFRERQSRSIVAIDECPIMQAPLERVLCVLNQWLKGDSKRAVSHIELLASDAITGVVVRHTKPLLGDDRHSLATSLAKITDIPPCELWFQADSNSDLKDAFGEQIDPRLRYCLGSFDVTIAFHPLDFVQSNPGVNRQMVDQAIALMAPKAHEHIVDFFCGVGNFSLPLATEAGQVTGFEGDAAMVRRARENAVSNQLQNVAFYTSNLSVNDSLVSQLGEVDGVLLDPPRSGALAICQQMGKLNPKRLVYVSCDISTFVRDTVSLQATGYTLDALGIMDMFPQTSHTEVMGLFVRS